MMNLPMFLFMKIQLAHLKQKNSAHKISEIHVEYKKRKLSEYK